MAQILVIFPAIRWSDVERSYKAKRFELKFAKIKSRDEDGIRTQSTLD